MKNVCIIFLLSIIISLTALGFSDSKPRTITQDYLRIHIRADSNEAEAQSVKYAVRDEIVDYLTPVVAVCETKEEAFAEIRTRLQALSDLATRILQEKGFAYGASAQLTRESFPTRIYGEYTLPAGEYTSLIIRLGSGKGDNWWCVVYPPLCFSSPTGENVIYKSKILEIIRKWQSE